MADAAVRLPESRVDVAGLLLERDQLSVPLHVHAVATQAFAHDELVVVLAEDENERIWSHLPPGLAERNDRCQRVADIAHRRNARLTQFPYRRP